MKQLLCAVLLLGCSTIFAQEEVMPPPIEAPRQNEPSIEVDELAEFPGGLSAMSDFLSTNMVYPQIAVELNLSGRTLLQFVVTEEGDVTSVSVRRGVPDCPECDAEAIRVVKRMPDWKPAVLDGKPVASLYILPIEFKLVGKKEQRRNRK